MIQNLEQLTKLITNGENRNAAAFLDKIRREAPCAEYAEAREKILLIEAAKRLNTLIPTFYFDEEKLAEELFSKNPPAAKTITDALCREVKEASRENHRRSFEKALSFIMKNLCDNQLSIGSVAEYVGISQSGLVKLFTENIGVKPSEYLGKMRAEKSLEYLAKNLSVEKTAFKVGFSSCETYDRTFKKHMGMSPGAWKRNKLFL